MLSFTLERKWVPFTLESDSGTESYILREMDGKERDAYENSVSKRAVRDEEGKTLSYDHDGWQASLLSRCVYKVDGFERDGGEKIVAYIGDPKLVSATVIQQWPASMQQQLHDEAKKINRLGKASGN